MRGIFRAHTTATRNSTDYFLSTYRRGISTRYVTTPYAFSDDVLVGAGCTHLNLVLHGRVPQSLTGLVSMKVTMARNGALPLLRACAYLLVSPCRKVKGRRTKTRRWLEESL
jgi:hypothetical protein